MHGMPLNSTIGFINDLEHLLLMMVSPANAKSVIRDIHEVTRSGANVLARGHRLRLW